MTSLRELMCVACRGDESPLDAAQIEGMRPEVPDWQVVEVDEVPRLVRVFKFKNFAKALDFTNRVGAAAEAQDHHPSILTEWGKVTVSWWTHKIHGLHKNDFIMAARTDELYRNTASD